MDKSLIEVLQSRWNSQLVNRIVIALNEGRSIETILEEMPQQLEIPPVQNRLDLRGIDLSHQNLRGPWELDGDERRRMGVKLRDADMSYGILSWVILPKADLRGALLKDADLSHAELIYTDFSNADLTGACFTAAWLLDTLFHGAKVTEAQLKGRRNLGQLDFDYHAYEI